ncbi:cysteine desulfurase family protein [Roseimaritima sediminicola]|uniref:cysteine desulfurase family protein n=1 Tax=Roseimaritima sediminicola TaxID=2662066 RepID=UPI0012983C74|nr:cysteine desulfurase family protein [Roseimaritima sediminicola]
MQPIYLDFNTTTPLAPSVQESMQPYWAEHFLLPDQEHHGSRAIAEGLERAREGVAEMIGCDAFEIVFTDGGTEANNLAVLGLATDCPPGHMLISELEHDSVWNAARSLQRAGWDIEAVPCGSDGVVVAEEFTVRLRTNTRLACLQAANPVLGTLQPVREVAEACHAEGVLVHCDASQMFGKLPVDISRLRADTLSISGHKFYGPKGTGALYVRRGLVVRPIRFGESREMGVRPGTENVPGLVGLGTAAQLAARCAVEAADRLSELTDRFVFRLRDTIDPAVEVACETSPRLPNTVTLILPTAAHHLQRVASPLIVATAQSAAPADEMTRCLAAIGMAPPQIRGALRVSIGWTTSQEQIDRAADLIAEAWDQAMHHR